VRVLIATNMWPTDDEPAFGCFVKEQSEDLRATGLDVDVVHFDGRRDSLNYVRAARRIHERVRRKGYDVVHAHYGLTGAVASFQRRVPVVTTFHGSDAGYVRWQKPISWVVARRTTPVFVSDFVARELGFRNGVVIPAPVDTELFTPVDRDAARDALGWPRGVPHVLFPGGRSNRRKRPDLFESAIRVVRRSLPDVQDVYLEGYGRAEVARVLNAVDVTLMTSDWEGSPVAVRESLACNTPVVSVPVGDVPRIIDGLPACAVAQRDPLLLADAVLASLGGARSESLRERVLGTSRSAVAERLGSVYNDVVGRTSLRRMSRKAA
jgi:glycosyltransferase involved in cell wall biosynthesis